jgi:glycosyltransferase involved in cell wall biosynthesis
MHQLASEVHLYPCIYDENFCIAAAETQAAGCYALTTGQGALSTTNFTGKILNSLPEFVASSIAFLQKPESERRKIQYYTQKNAIKRFSWDKILDYWENTILA